MRVVNRLRFLLFPAPWLVCLGLAGLLTAGAMPARAAMDEIVPDGIWLVRGMVGKDRHTRAIARNDKERPLKDYLISESGYRDQVRGKLTRDIQYVTLDVHYGLSDSWNLALEVPHLSIEQHSTLSTDSSDPAVQGIVEQLPGKTVDGAGDIRMTSLHRPVFSDRNGFIWGYGLQIPSGSQQSPYTGVGTLSTRSPTPWVFGLMHYTYYPYIDHSRFDLRAEFRTAIKGRVDTPEGDKVSIRPGNVVDLQMGWSQEFGPVSMAMALRHHSQGFTSLGSKNQQDPVIENAARLELGFGNLIELEEHPLPFPYQVTLQYEHTLGGYNTPLRSDLSLSFQTYF